jgi:hypothetical protein
MNQKGYLPVIASCFRNKTFLELNKGQCQKINKKISMRFKNKNKNIMIFQRHPAQLSIKEKQNKNVNKSCGKCL